jgi:hypothetical protein
MAVARKSTSRSSKEIPVEPTVTDTQQEISVSQSHRVATQTTEAKKKETMSNIPSIIEYDEDLANAEAPVPLPIGDYPATIRSAEVKKSAAGNDYINVTFYIDPEAYPADFTEGDEDGQILSFGRISPANTQRARWGMRKFQEAIGAKLSKQVDLNDWIGLSAIVAVGHDTYEGETRAQIKQVKPV